MPRTGKDTYGWAAFNIGSYTKDNLADLSNCEKIKSVKDMETFPEGRTWLRMWIPPHKLKEIGIEL